MQLTLALEDSIGQVSEANDEHISELDKHGLISFAEKKFVCDCQGTLFWPERRCLIISDLHLEKGASHARRGQLIPPYDTALTLNRLKTQIEKWDPQTIISLGDSFHDEQSANGLPNTFIAQLKKLAQGRRWIWITGNHDRTLPNYVSGEILDQIKIDGICFTHEPEQALALGQYEICGHLHPKAQIAKRGKRVSRKCFAFDGSRLIMPAFGAYTGGLDLAHKAFKDLFDTRQLFAVLLGRERVYQISRQNLGL